MQFWCMVGPLQKGSSPEPEPVCLKNTLKEAFGAQLPSFKQVSSVNFGQTHGICFLPLSNFSNPKWFQAGILRQQELPSPSVPTLSGRRRQDSTTLRATLEAWAVIALQSSDENAKKLNYIYFEKWWTKCLTSSATISVKMTSSTFVDLRFWFHHAWPPNALYSRSLLPLSQATQVWGSQLVRQPAQHSQKPHPPPGIANNRWMNFCCMRHFQIPRTVTMAIK